METAITRGKKGCLYCGNNPTNHTLSYISQSITAVTLPLARSFEIFISPRVFAFIHNTFVRIWMGTLEWFHFISFQNESEHACTDRSRVIWEEANARGILMQQMVIANKYIEQYRAQIGGHWFYFTSIPLPLMSNRSAYSWMDSKAQLKKVLSEGGVRVPQGGPAHSLKEGLVIFNRIQKPVIVKPESGSRGRHSLTNLKTEVEFIHAFKIAQQLCYSVVVEEHLS